MNVVWAVLCQSVVIDKDTNNLSLFNILEEITVVSQPPQVQPGRDEPDGGIPLALELVTLWVRSIQDNPERGYGRLRFVTPAGDFKTGPEFEIDLTKYLRLRHRLRINGLPIVSQGIFRFVIEGKGERGEWIQKSEVPLRVVIQRGEN